MIVALTPFINKPDSSKDLTFSMMSSMLLPVLSPKDVCSILRFFLFIPTSATDSATVNPNGIRNLLANCLSTFFIKG